MATERQAEDWLDRVLHEEQDYIADAGFSARVMSALPATHRPWYASRSVVLLLATVIACGAGLVLPGVANYILTSLIDIFTLKSFSPDKLAVLVPIALLYWGGLSAAVAER
jgi:hypothetical protein